MRGVFTARKKDQTVYYRASITYARKHISLGSFTKEEDANQAYLEADRILKDYSITVDSYQGDSILSFEKWVILINYRENHMYFGTPIYVRPKFFYYYLSPDIVLKFDTDDLFYYSSHKIMKRKGHLFVADYGMQVNIMNRYGIKNYAVLGKDYKFINGDNTDFRRSNIQVFNTYQGVSKEIKNGKTYYKAKINLPGSYTIGTYKTDIEAAIAYNKAIDVLTTHGVTRNLTPNDIDNLAETQYMEIYENVKISEKIIQFQPTFGSTPAL